MSVYERPAMGNATPKPARGTGKLKRYERRQKERKAIADAEAMSKVEAQRADRAIRFHCYLRDKRQCRAFGVPLLFDTDNPKRKSENHHITPKSLGGSDLPENRITLSWLAHRMRHDGELDITGDGNGDVRFTQYTFEGGTRRLLREWVSSCL